MFQFQVWQFTFLGAKASKYSTELLELACGFLYEFPPTIQTTIKNNWLCNFSGYPGCWLPMDLMQEHHIRELKEKSQRRDQDFEGRFFQQVVSRNTRWFSRFRAAVSRAVDLKDWSASHSETNHSPALNQLRTSLKNEHVHTFVPGRSYDWVARDDSMIGQELMPKKILRFLQRSPTINSNSASALAPLDPAEPEDVTEEEEEPLDVPLPAMVMNGRLVLGDAHDGEEEDESLGEDI